MCGEEEKLPPTKGCFAVAGTNCRRLGFNQRRRMHL
jgi:hypothetical protein